MLSRCWRGRSPRGVGRCGFTCAALMGGSSNRICNMKASSLAFYLLCSMLFLAVGCALTGAIADKVAPPERIPAKYLGLAGQSVGVAVWIDRGLQIDYPS